MDYPTFNYEKDTNFLDSNSYNGLVGVSHALTACSLTITELQSFVADGCFRIIQRPYYYLTRACVPLDASLT
jgi:hypothetical protein